jgi:hypothetical protein
MPELSSYASPIVRNYVNKLPRQAEY